MVAIDMKRYRVAGSNGPGMTGDELIFAAELAFAGGLLDEMPNDVDGAIDAFAAIDLEIEELT